MRKITALQWISIWLYPALQVSAFVAFCIGINQNIWTIVFLPISAFSQLFTSHNLSLYSSFPTEKQRVTVIDGSSKVVADWDAFSLLFYVSLEPSPA